MATRSSRGSSRTRARPKSGNGARRRAPAPTALQTGLDRLPVAFALFDAKLRLAAWNAGLASICRYPKRLLARGTSIEAFVQFNAERGDYGAGETLAVVGEELKTVRRKARREREQRLADGRVIRISSRPVPPDHLLVTYEDVTEARLAGQRYDFASRAVNEGIYDWDIAAGKIYFSERVYNAVGLSPDDFRTVADWRGRIHPDDLGRFDAGIVAHLKGKTDRFECDYRFRTRDGTWRWARQHGIALRDERGRAIRMIGSTGDINELKGAEEALRLSEERYALAMRAATEGVYEWNLDTGKLYVSDTTKVFFWSRTESLTPESWNERVHPGDIAAYRKAIGDHFKGRTPHFELEYRIRDASGGYIWVLDRGVGVRDARKRVTRFVGAVSDVTQRKLAEQELRRAHEETTRALEQQTATAEILRAISGSQADVTPVFEAILSNATRLCDSPLAAIFRFDGKLLHLVATKNWPPEALAIVAKRYPMAPDRSLTSGRTILAKSIVREPDTFADPEYDQAAAAVGQWRRMLGVPMLRDGEPIGAFVMAWPEPGETPERHVQMLKTFADQAVIAIENVRLFNETKEALERQTATAKILHVIASSPTDVQPVLDAVAASAARLCEARDAIIVLREGDDFRFAAHYGPIPNLPVGGTRRISRNTAVGRSMLEGRQIHVHDLQAETAEFPEGSAYAREFGYHTSLVTPLMREGAAIGTIMIRRTEVRPFSDKQIALVSTFADQAVIAIENVRLFNETKEALERQTATAEILRVIASSPSDVQPVFDAIARSAYRLIGGFSTAVARVFDDVLHLVAFSSTGEAGNEALKSAFPMPVARSKAARTGAPVCISDTEALPESASALRELARVRGFRSIVIVPMLREGVATGTISVTRKEPGEFTNHHVDLLKTFADQAVIAIENVRLFNETKEALERQTATAAVLRVISASPNDLAPVFAEILDHATRLCEAEFGFVFTSDGQAFDPVAQRGLDAEKFAAWSAAFRSHRIPGPLSGLGRVLSTKAPVSIADIADDEAYRARDPLRVLTVEVIGARTFLAVPLIKQSAIIGSVVIYRREVRPFSQKQVALLQTFADQAVIAIENVRLFNETREALQRQTATAEILDVISRSQTDVQPVFDTIAANALKLCEARFSVVTRFDGELIHVAALHNAIPEAANAIRNAFPRPPGRAGATDRAYLERKIVHIPDIREDPEYQLGGLAQAAAYRSTVCVPMLRSGSAVGAVTVARPDAGPFPKQQIALLKTFADQAVIAIENVRLFQELQQSNREISDSLEQQTATSEILRVISSSPTDTRPVFEAIASSALRLFGSLYVAVVLARGTQIELVAAEGASDVVAKVKDAFPIPLDRESVTGRTIVDRAVQNIPDMSAPELPEFARALSARAGVRALLGAPMLREGAAIGAIMLFRDHAGEFREKHVSLLQTFADQAVIAIENARLFNETKEALERQTATAEILKVIASSPTDMQPVFNTIADSAMRLFGAWSTGVFRFDGELLHVGAVRGALPDSEEFVRQRFPQRADASGVMGRCVLERAPQQNSDAWNHPDPRVREIAQLRGHRAILAVPILSKSEPIGLVTATRKEPGDFAEVEVELLRTFADQAAIAIENVRLFNETKEALERQTATAEILEVIGSSPTDTQPVFDAIVQSGLRLFSGATVGVALPDGALVRMAAIANEDPAVAEITKARFPVKLGREYLHGAAILGARLIDIPDAELAREGAFAPGVANFLATGNRAITIMPMQRGGQAIGTISVTRAVPGPLSEKQISLLRTFADQAVIAIENVRLFNETKEALERQTATSEILNVIASSPSNVQPVFDAIAKSALRLVGGLSAAVTRIVGEMRHLAAFTTTDERGDEALKSVFPAPVSRGFVGTAIEARAPVFVSDIETDPEASPEFRELARARRYRSVIFVPMLRDEAVVGTISVTRREPGPFSDHHINLLKTFADQAVIAIENVRLFNETKEALEQQTAISEVLRVISGSPTDVNPVLEAVATRAARICDASDARIFLVEGGQFRHAAGFGDTPVVTPAFPVDRDSASGRAVLELVPIQIDDIEAESGDEYAVSRESARRAGWRTALAVPLTREKVALGTIALRRKEVRPFNERQISLLRTFADQAALAIENVRLFNETKEALERQTATADVLRVISSSPTNLEPVYRTILENITRLCESQIAALFLYDGEFLSTATTHGTTAEFAELLERARFLPSAKTTSRLAALERRTIHVADLLSDSAFSPEPRELYERENTRTVLSVPMLREKSLVGVITTWRREVRPFSDRQIGLVQTFADQAVIAIENVRLFNETKEALERQTATGEILASISSSMADAQPVFDAIVRSLRRLFSAQFSAVFLKRDNKVAIAAQAGDEKFAIAARQAYPLPLDDDEMMAVRAIRRAQILRLCPIVGNPDSPPKTERLAKAGGYDSILVAPMLRDGVAIGAVAVARAQPLAFDEHQVALIKSFADQAVIAIENARLFNETKEALERQTATAEILKVIARSPSDVQPVFDAIMRSAARLFVPFNSAIYMVEDQRLVVRAVAVTNDPVVIDSGALERLFPMPLERSFALGKAITEKRTIVIQDTEAPEFPKEAKEISRAFNARSSAFIPLLREGDAIGVIAMGGPAPGLKLSDNQLALAKTFADQAVIAIENVRLFNETREALERQTATAEILNVISSSPRDLRPVFDAILEKAMHLCEAHMGFLGLYDGEKYEHVAERGSSAEFSKWIARGPFVPDSRMVLAHALRDRKPVQWEDLRDSQGYRDRVEPMVRTVEVAGARTILAVPMLNEGRSVGAIIIYRPEVRQFTGKQIDLVATFASQAVIAIENVRLFKELEARTEALTRSVGQLMALGEVGQAISSTLDLETVLKTIVKHAVQLTGLDGGSIYEYDEPAEVFSLQAAEKIEPELVEAVRKTPVRKGEGAIGTSAVTLEPTQVADILDDSYQTVRKEILVRAGYRAILAVPLVREDHLIGALQVFRRTAGGFAPEVIELLKTFATQSAMAIQNARLFREIADKGRQLEVASRHKSQFLASMSHELRTPLNAILGFNEMILDQVYGELTEDLRAPLENMQSSGKHLLRLINNVLDLAKIEAGRMELALSDYSVQDTVASVHSTLKPLAADKGLEFLASVPQDIPLAYGDGGRIAQCLMNLAGNSLKFTKAGKVEIGVEQKDSLLLYRVADTGIGIPPEKIGSLFTEFKQTDATIASEYGGTGLGLSITKKFIEMHGGRIWVESEPGKGSTFLFEIPLRAAQ